MSVGAINLDRLTGGKPTKIALLSRVNKSMLVLPIVGPHAAQ